jgi:hypothetical protein
MSGDHNQYQKDKSYLDFECPRCGHCCYVDADDTSQNHVDEIVKDEHEPVAWRTFDGEGGYDYRSYEMNETYDKEWAERNPNHKGWVEPLYTAPPQRTWVGLTVLEVYECWKTGDVVEAVEAKLKEKNHG